MVALLYAPLIVSLCGAVQACLRERYAEVRTEWALIERKGLTFVKRELAHHAVEVATIDAWIGALAAALK